jgi:tetratricopeptide (TPR) repeat protein
MQKIVKTSIFMSDPKKSLGVQRPALGWSGSRDWRDAPNRWFCRNYAGLVVVAWCCLATLGMATCKKTPQNPLSSQTSGNSNAPKQNPSPQPPSQVVEKLNPELSPIRNLISTNQNGAARVRLADHLKIHPTDGQAVFLFGLTYHREKKYAQAVPHFDRALTLPPLYMPINYFRGWALYYLGEAEKSRQAFQSFLQLKPDEPDAHFALGLIAQEEGDLDEAKERFQRSIELVNAQGGRDVQALSKAHTRLAEVFEQRGDLEQAKLNLVVAVKLFPDQYEALYKLYRVHVRLGEHDQAQAVHAQYLATKERVRPGTSFPE